MPLYLATDAVIYVTAATRTHIRILSAISLGRRSGDEWPLIALDPDPWKAIHYSPETRSNCKETLSEKETAVHYHMQYASIVGRVFLLFLSRHNIHSMPQQRRPVQCCGLLFYPVKEMHCHCHLITTEITFY